MSLWCRGLMLAIGLCYCVTIISAQGPTADPQREQREKDASTIFMQGEGRMKVAAYEEAIEQFQTVLKRYPDTTMRYQAQFRMADAFMALKKESDAMTLLHAVVKEESPEWSPQALAHIGELYLGRQKYAEAFRAYRQIITDYPDSPLVDRAYFAIGSTHFALGHYELAAADLDKVGTVYASTMPELQRVSPGDPLYIRLNEGNTVATATAAIPVTLTTKNGDREKVSLVPEVEGGDRFVGTISTEMATPKPGDGRLQVYGNDTVTMAYNSRYVGGGGTEKSVTMATASNGRLFIRDSKGNEIRALMLTDTVTVEVNDPDRDITEQPDTLTVDVTTQHKDVERLTLTETGAHTGTFRSTLATLKGAPVANSGSVETDADALEGSATQLDDTVTITYLDDSHLGITAGAPRKVSAGLAIIRPSDGGVDSPDDSATGYDLTVKKLLYKGRSLSQIAATYRDLGQEARAASKFREAEDLFQQIRVKYPQAPEVEDALYGLFENDIAQEQYESAVGIIAEITRLFPQSARSSMALLDLASLQVKRKEYDLALGIYQSLAQKAQGTALAEEAQFAICTTYTAMLKPDPGASAPPPVNRAQVAFALEEFARMYPQSERAPEALLQLVQFRFDGDDYLGAVDVARRVYATYPDHVITGRALLLMAQAQVKLKDYDGAITTLQTIKSNYGNEEGPADQMLKKLHQVAPTKPAQAETR